MQWDVDDFGARQSVTGIDSRRHSSVYPVPIRRDRDTPRRITYHTFGGYIRHQRLSLFGCFRMLHASPYRIYYLRRTSASFNMMLRGAWFFFVFRYVNSTHPRAHAILDLAQHRWLLLIHNYCAGSKNSCTFCSLLHIHQRMNQDNYLL